MSRYSKTQDAAIQYIRYLVSPDVQTWRAIAGSFVPTIPAVAQKPEVLAVQPYLSTMADVDRVAAHRPCSVSSTTRHRRLFQGVSQILGGQDATQVLPDVQRKLQALLRKDFNTVPLSLQRKP